MSPLPTTGTLANYAVQHTYTTSTTANTTYRIVGSTLWFPSLESTLTYLTGRLNALNQALERMGQS